MVSVADRRVPDRISAEARRRKRDRGKEENLAPDGKQRRGKPDRGLQPLERDGRVSLKRSSHRGTGDLSQWHH